jgi:hypothetical protein
MFDAMLKRLHGHRGATLKETALPILSAKASEASKVKQPAWHPRTRLSHQLATRLLRHNVSEVSGLRVRVVDKTSQDDSLESPPDPRKPRGNCRRDRPAAPGKCRHDRHCSRSRYRFRLVHPRRAGPPMRGLHLERLRPVLALMQA